jgi:hypothetical protein
MERKGEIIMENDNVNHPKHYQNGLTVEVECIMFSRHLGFTLGNAFKYVWRAGMKDDIKQDIKKALWYLDDANAWDVKVCRYELIDFLPKFDQLNWKYNILRYILQGDIEMAQSLLYSKLKQLNTAS